MTDDEMKELSNYFLDNYGECLSKDIPKQGDPACKCLKYGWRGQDCPNWKPLGVSNLEELIKTMENNKNYGIG